MPNDWKSQIWTKLQQATSKNILPIVVFDLDSTLFSTAPRNFRILQEFVDLHGASSEDLVRAAAKLSEERMGWNVHEDLRSQGFRDEALIAELRSFWRDRFFSNHYIEYDRPLRGAAAFAIAAHTKGALVYYLSGRHVGGMEEGTVRALRRHGFPYWRGRCVVHLKPSFEMADASFKADALDDIRSYRGQVVATFENEPANANIFLRAFPEALHFLLDTIHSPNAETPDPSIHHLPDFR